jgi:hypothetical protein
MACRHGSTAGESESVDALTVDASLYRPANSIEFRRMLLTDVP